MPQAAVATYLQLADDTAGRITHSHQEWTDFLKTAARLYKYPYHEQLMIYAQRPDAIACAEYDLWNSQMRRYVRRGSKGIALVDTTGSQPKLRYVFDVTDTGKREHSIEFTSWSITEENRQVAETALENGYDVPAREGLTRQLRAIANLLCHAYWSDHQQDILSIVDDSYLEGYDEFNVGAAFRKAATVSLEYALLSRCGLNPDQCFQHEDFLPIFDWNTPEAVAVLGSAVSEMSEEVLRTIEISVRNQERSINHERNHLSAERGLSDTQPDNQPNGAFDQPVRQNAPDLPAGEPSNIVQFPDRNRQAVSAPAGDRGRGQQPYGTDDARNDEDRGSNGEPESRRSDEVGRPDEQLESASGGDHPDGADLQLDEPAGRTSTEAPPPDVQLSFFPTEVAQIAQVDQAESQTPSALVFAAPRFSQEEIDRVLIGGTNESNGRFHILMEYQKGKATAEIAAMLPQVFVGGKGTETDRGRICAWYAEDGIHLSRGTSARYAVSAQDIPWITAAERIGKLLEQGQYATYEELALAPSLERKELAQALWYLRQDLDEKGADYLTTIGEHYNNGFPDGTSEISELLESAESHKTLTEEIRTFIKAYEQDRSLLRFHFHNSQNLLQRMEELELPRRDYESIIAELPQKAGFITQDEIDRALTERYGYSGGNLKAYAYFHESHTQQEKAAFLKDLYGIGGCSHALSGTTGSWMDYDSKGIRFRKDGCEDVSLSWTVVAKRIDDLIVHGRYLTQADLDRVRQQEDKATPAVVEPQPDSDDEMSEFFAIDKETVLEALEERGIVDGALADPDKLAQDTFIRQVEADAEAIQRETDIEAELDQLEAAEPTVFPFSVGDTLYLEHGSPFVIEEVGLFAIRLREPVQAYPILRAESRESMARLLARYPQPEHASVPAIQPAAENFRITDEHLGEGGAKTKYAANITAIRTLQIIEAENRSATPEEQEILSHYVGWGGIPQAFDPENQGWIKEYNELKGLLSESEYVSARSSTLNAHFTSPTVIRAIYDAVERMGFTTGNILEPACGVGNFFGLLPESMKGSNLYGVELDSVTGRIARQLYPQANITVAGFETTDHRDFYDLAIGNVPFGNYKVLDKPYDKLNFNIHDYFFAKAIDQVRPGGVIAFITSKGTMDKQSPEVRKYLAQRAELLGAVRLPNNVFKANAGTEVTTDILFLQKRDRAIDIEPDWVHLAETEDGILVNSYFAEHPEMLLGTMAWDDSMYGNHRETACLPSEGAEISEQLAAAMEHINGQITEVAQSELSEGEPAFIPADPNVRNYSYAIVGDEVYYRENSRMVKPYLGATTTQRVKGLVALRDCVQRLIDQQMDGTPDEIIQQTQTDLNTRYDDFTVKYGLINSRGNANIFSDDSAYYLLCSLEILDENGALDRKADMFTRRTIRSARAVEHVDTAAEALAVSIAERAQVNMPYMAQLSEKTEEELAADLRSVIFRLPQPLDASGNPQYVTADEYLSGNVREKLAIARRAAETSDLFTPNVAALEQAMPRPLEASEIDVRLGATWIDKSYIQSFMEETFEPPFYARNAIRVNFASATAEWNITSKSSIPYNDVSAYTTYGTQRAIAYRILEDTLNLRDVRIYDTVQDAEGKEKRVLNKNETTFAQQKQQAIKDAFRDWVWRDADRRKTLVNRYNVLFNSTRPREYSGEHITFSGMNPEISLRPHQSDAIAHILYGGNTLLAHEVGAGKTFEMVAAVMESKRLGLCQKALFAVPNHLTEQWAGEFLRLYPSANILVATKKDFETKNRKKFCARIATGDYDAIIMGHSQFEKIPVSRERLERLLQEEINEIEDGISEMKSARAERFTIKQMERTKKQLEAKLKKLTDTERKDDVVTFEQLGVDRLYVDEAHGFKNRAKRCA